MFLYFCTLIKSNRQSFYTDVCVPGGKSLGTGLCSCICEYTKLQITVQPTTITATNRYKEYSSAHDTLSPPLPCSQVLLCAFFYQAAIKISGIFLSVRVRVPMMHGLLTQRASSFGTVLSSKKKSEILTSVKAST